MFRRWLTLTTTTSPNSLRLRPSYAYDSIDDPLVKPPPCIQTITGFLRAGVRLCVQTFRYWQFSFAMKYRCGNTSSSELTVVCSGAGQTGPHTWAFLMPSHGCT